MLNPDVPPGPDDDLRLALLRRVPPAAPEDAAGLAEAEASAEAAAVAAAAAADGDADDADADDAADDDFLCGLLVRPRDEDDLRIAALVAGDGLLLAVAAPVPALAPLPCVAPTCRRPAYGDDDAFGGDAFGGDAFAVVPVAAGAGFVVAGELTAAVVVPVPPPPLFFLAGDRDERFREEAAA